MYFKTTITYYLPVEGEEDSQLYHKENYLVNAVSVTDAEAKIIKELPDNYNDKDVKGVIHSNVNRVVHASGDNWFLVGVKYETGINKKGKTTYSHEYVMINGKDIGNALENLIENNKVSVNSYLVNSIQESKIIVDRGLLTTDTVI